MPRSSLKRGVQEKNAIQGQEVLGRIKHSDIESELVEQSSVHS